MALDFTLFLLAVLGLVFFGGLLVDRTEFGAGLARTVRGTLPGEERPCPRL
jgi:hypothetical protein